MGGTLDVREPDAAPDQLVPGLLMTVTVMTPTDLAKAASRAAAILHPYSAWCVSTQRVAAAVLDRLAELGLLVRTKDTGEPAEVTLVTTILPSTAAAAGGRGGRTVSVDRTCDDCGVEPASHAWCRATQQPTGAVFDRLRVLS